MAKELRAAGFTVQLQKDLNYRSMVKVIESFANTITGGDEVVVFYAGHGVQIKNGSYLLPTDIEANSEKEVEKTAYELLALTDMISEAKPAFSLVMVDACRDNPLKSSGRSGGNSRGLSAIEPPKGQIVVYSASRGQQALDKLNDKDKNPNGVFTREFISRMKKPGVKIEDLMREVQDAVETLAKTVNHEQRPAIYNETRGNFYFFNPSNTQIGQTPPKPGSTSPILQPGNVDGLNLSNFEREEATRKELVASVEKQLPFRAYNSNYPRKILEFFKSKLDLYAHKPFMGNPSAEVEINCDPDGSIVSWQIIKSSQNDEWDEVIRQTMKRTQDTSKIPKDIDERVPSKLFIKVQP